MPGPYKDSMSNKTAPNITLYFTRSDGIVSNYSAKLLGVDNDYNSTVYFAPQNNDSQQVTFFGIEAGKYYKLYITAYSSTSQSEVYESERIRGSVKRMLYSSLHS